MRIDAHISDMAVLSELGSRLARYRLNRNMKQEALAKEAGISLPTLQRIERGHSTNITNIIRVLRSLGLLENLEIVIPGPPVSPMMQMKMAGKTRRRASPKQKTLQSDEPWTWGDKE